jgi:hypothetical protein
MVMLWAPPTPAPAARWLLAIERYEAFNTVAGALS